MSFTFQDALGLAVLLAVGLALLIVVTAAFIAWRLTHPPRRTVGNAVARSLPTEPGELDTPLPFESWTLQTGARSLPAWTIEGRHRTGPAIILAHGWGDSRLGALARVPALAQRASQVIAFDLPGQGESPGACALGTREHEHLLAAIDRTEGPVVLFGWSLGAGSAIRAAAADRTGRVAAVIAEAPYRLPPTPARNVLALAGLPHRIPLPIAFGLLRLFLGPGIRSAAFDRAGWASQLRVPMLVLHGRDDEVCPVDDGKQIAERAERATFAPIEAAGHNDLWTAPHLRSACTEAVHDFLGSLAASR